MFIKISTNVYCKDDRPPISERRFPASPSSSDLLSDRRTDLIPQPTVTIMVESPQEAPINCFPNDSIPAYVAVTDQPEAGTVRSQETVIDIDVPIDVNIPRDTTNIFYDYSPEVDPHQSISYNQPRLNSNLSDQVSDTSSSPVVSSTDVPSTVIDIGDVSRPPTTTS